MFTKDEINELHTASEARQVSEAANAKQNLNAVVRSINLAANTGQTRIIWISSIDSNTLTALKTAGYTIEPSPCATGDRYVISW